MSAPEPHLPGIVAGDPEAMGQWIAGAEPRIRASLRSFATRVDTEAVLQETLLRVWQVAPRFQPRDEPGGLTSLALRIARNLAIDVLRRERVEPVELDQLEQLEQLEQLGAAVEPPLPDPLLRERIRDCLDELPNKPSQAINARVNSIGQRNDHDLADEVGMTLNTFLQNVRRARLALAECLGRHGVDVAWGRW